jgi:hypothetical protein
VSILKPCASFGCSRLIPRGLRFCREHEAADRARRDEKRARFGYSRPHWRRLRSQRLMLADGLCELQLPGCSMRATHVHLDPRLAGNHDAAAIDDCRACCASCSGAVDAPRAHAEGVERGR